MNLRLSGSRQFQFCAARSFFLFGPGCLGLTQAVEITQEHRCVLVTAPNISVARKLASAALTQQLVACANLVPKIESHYWWQGQVESSSEVLILFKTRADKLEALEKCVLQIHPYQTPEFVALKIDVANEKYLGWINESVTQP